MTEEEIYRDLHPIAEEVNGIEVRFTPMRRGPEGHAEMSSAVLLPGRGLFRKMVQAPLGVRPDICRERLLKYWATWLAENGASE